MANKWLHEWTNEDGIKCHLRDDGKIFKTLIRGVSTIENPCDPDWFKGLIVDEAYDELARKHLQKIEEQKRRLVHA